MVAVGGTDALMLSLNVSVWEGDEVITTPYTFYATIGAIVTAGAFQNLFILMMIITQTLSSIEKAITNKTKAITSSLERRVCEMEKKYLNFLKNIIYQ